MYYIYDADADKILKECETREDACCKAGWLVREDENLDLWVVDEIEYKERVWEDEIPGDLMGDDYGDVIYPDDDYDFGFNPYMGCYDYDC